MWNVNILKYINSEILKGILKDRILNDLNVNKFDICGFFFFK